eukprot:3031373-Lingulodinium_polyedra.AAC.1
MFAELEEQRAALEERDLCFLLVVQLPAARKLAAVAVQEGEEPPGRFVAPVPFVGAAGREPGSVVFIRAAVAGIPRRP